MKLKENLCNNEKATQLLAIYIMIQPILDVFTEISNLYFPSFLSIGIIVRGIFLVVLLLKLFISKDKSKEIIYLLLYGVFCFIYLTLHYLDRQLLIYTEIIAIFKVIYLPITLTSFHILKVQIPIKAIMVSYYIYIGILIITYIVGIGGNSYLPQDNKTGFISLFDSPNQISAILIGLMPIVIHELLNYKTNIIKICGLVGIAFSVVVIGTKVMLFGFALVCLYFIVPYISRGIKNRNHLILFIVIIIIISIIVIPQIPAVKNIGVALHFYGISSLKELFTIDNIDKVFLGRRIAFMKDTISVYKNSGVLYQIFGIGFSNLPIKTIEMDFFDILFRTGVLGLLSFISSNILIVKQHNYTANIRYSFFLFILISFFSGHVFTAPAVSIYIACIPFIKESYL